MIFNSSDPWWLPDDLHIVWHQMVITHTKFGFHLTFGYKEIPLQRFPRLDLSRPCIQTLCTPWKKHYFRNIITNFKNILNVLGVKEDTLLRLPHNSLFWPLNDLWTPLPVVQNCPTHHYIQVSSNSIETLFESSLDNCWQTW